MSEKEEVKSHAYSLGVYLAEYIMHVYMPSLSCKQWTRNAIQVTWGEAKELKRLEDAWYNKRISEERRILKENPGLKGAERYKKEQEAHKFSEDEWNALIKYGYVLKEKYLPHTLKCMVNFIDFSDQEANKEIKKGFISSMWDSDHCEYSLKKEDIIFENEIYKFGKDNRSTMCNTWVTMKLDLEPPSSYTGEGWIEIKTDQKGK